MILCGRCRHEMPETFTGTACERCGQRLRLRSKRISGFSHPATEPPPSALPTEDRWDLPEAGGAGAGTPGLVLPLTGGALRAPGIPSGFGRPGMTTPGHPSAALNPMRSTQSINLEELRAEARRQGFVLDDETPVVPVQVPREAVREGFAPPPGTRPLDSSEGDGPEAQTVNAALADALDALDWSELNERPSPAPSLGLPSGVRLELRETMTGIQQLPRSDAPTRRPEPRPPVARPVGPPGAIARPAGIRGTVKMGPESRPGNASPSTPPPTPPEASRGPVGAPRATPTPRAGTKTLVFGFPKETSVRGPAAPPGTSPRDPRAASTTGVGLQAPPSEAPPATAGTPPEVPAPTAQPAVEPSAASGLSEAYLFDFADLAPTPEPPPVELPPPPAPPALASLKPPPGTRATAPLRSPEEFHAREVPRSGARRRGEDNAHSLSTQKLKAVSLESLRDRHINPEVGAPRFRVVVALAGACLWLAVPLGDVRDPWHLVGYGLPGLVALGCGLAPWGYATRALLALCVALPALGLDLLSAGWLSRPGVALLLVLLALLPGALLHRAEFRASRVARGLIAGGFLAGLAWCVLPGAGAVFSARTVWDLGTVSAFGVLCLLSLPALLPADRRTGSRAWAWGLVLVSAVPSVRALYERGALTSRAVLSHGLGAVGLAAVVLVASAALLAVYTSPGEE